MFVFFAAAAVTWSVLILRESLSTRRRSTTTLLVASAVAVAAAVVSIVSDVRSIQLGRGAQRADVAIRIVGQEDWWQIAYDGGGSSFLTANELHVPIGTAVSLSWSGLPPPWIDGAVCLPAADDRCILVAGDDAAARFVRLWPPMWRRLPIVAEPRPRFERWLHDEAMPARRSHDGGAELFESAGCGYCHVIRGVAASPWQLAPDLTHFAARRTIAAAGLPNRRGFLAGWIVHSRGLKRGSAMPDNRLDPHVLHGVIAYLESLR